MKKPVRLQLSRKKGFDLQALSRATNGRDAVHVARPGKWGNPFVIGKDGTRADCVNLFETMLGGHICLTTVASVEIQSAFLLMAGHDVAELRGKNLACWCSARAPCHADLLLEIANRRMRK